MMVIMSDAGDRRRAPRARFSGIVLVRAEDFDINCVGGDLSESGMLLYPTRPPPVLPTRLRITFTLPGSSHWLNADAELVRQKRVARRTLWAIRFTYMEEDAKVAMRAYIEENDVSATDPLGVPANELANLRPEGRGMTPIREGFHRRREPSQPATNPARRRRASEEQPVQHISMEAALPDELPDTPPTDPTTLVLSSDEVDHLAAASVMVNSDEEGAEPPPPPEEDELEDDAQTNVRGERGDLPRRRKP
jgi:hypothetical protein